MENEVTETAKAVQEVAKTTGKAIDATDRIGRFFSRVMNESIEATCGMLSDTLKYKRWERQVQFMEKANRLIADKNLSDTARPIKPKMALPIFHHASLEDEETLHDIWVRLFVTALDPDCQEPRSVFVDIISQLEPLDVQVLNVVYENYLEKKQETKVNEGHSAEYIMELEQRGPYEPSEITDDWERQDMLCGVDWDVDKREPTLYPCDIYRVTKAVRIDESTYRTSVDNLIRQRLISSYIKYQEVSRDLEDFRDAHVTSIHHGYHVICITAMGVSFVEACMSKK